MRAEPNEVEALHVAFRRAAELLAAGNGAWKVTPNALKAMRDAVSKFQLYNRNRGKDLTAGNTSLRWHLETSKQENKP